jgi:ankyrin repeat protein
VTNGDTLIGLIRDGRHCDAQRLLETCPALATSHSTESGQLHGASALHWAAHRNAAALCERLIELGADVNESASDWWRTPLAWGADAGSAEAVAVLLEHGANVNQDAAIGTTALHAVAQGGSSRGGGDPLAYQTTAELLIAYGADGSRRATRDRGQTPLEDAIASGNEAVAAVLRKPAARESS